MPKKRPEYRADRNHDSFITKISDYGLEVPTFHDSIKDRCNELYDVHEIVECDIFDWQAKTLDRLASSGDSRPPWKYRTRFETQY